MQWEDNPLQWPTRSIQEYGSERSRRIGGKQLITTVEGFHIPLNIKNGLAYLDIRPYTDAEFIELPHVHLTHDGSWDPTVLDNDANEKNVWYDAQQDLQDIKNDDPDSPFDSNGDLVFDNPLLARLELRKSLAANLHQLAERTIPREEWVNQESDSDDDSDDYSSDGSMPRLRTRYSSSDDSSSEDDIKPRG